ncbi:MAG: hypothetical protein JNL21_10375 [Myxococcales bacterium]|nr:hypothetical protein [Myxococcales bacterium]
MAAALAAELVQSLARRQLGSGLFPLVRWRSGRRDEIETSPFGATFVVHALRRARAALPDEPRAEAGAVVERTIQALRRAPDPDGRVRFLGPSSDIRPDVDDTACLWLALGDAGDPWPPSVLDAIERAALGHGGFANDFEPRAPAAVEIASTTAALALLARAGRSNDGAARYVARSAERICAGGAPSGFFFPSRFFAAFVVARAAIDLGVESLGAAAARLGAWVAEAARPEGPLLEQSAALWVLESTGGPISLRRALSESVAEAARADHDSEVWFTGDPRALERRGLELVGCPAVAEAIALDAWALARQPERRLASRRAPEAAVIERLDGAGPGARFRVVTGADEAVVEVVPAGPGVRAYRLFGAWAVSYLGRDSSRGSSAADAIIAAGLDRLMAGAGDRAAPAGRERLAICLGGSPATDDNSVILPLAACAGCLDRARCAAGSGEEERRPRRSDEPLADLLAFLTRTGFTTPALLDDAAALRAAVSDLARAELELSFKVRGDDLLEGPRLTFYQHAPDAARVLEIFASIAGDDGRPLSEALRDVVAGLPLHLGTVHAPDGRRATKLYVRTDGADRARLRAVLAAPEGGLRSGNLMDEWIHGVGFSVSGGSVRTRGYVVVPRERVTGDRDADRWALEGWDLTRDAEPTLEARYVHYRGRVLPWSRAAELGRLGPSLSRRIGAGLDRAGRWYARFFGLPAASDARSIYFTLGPRVPRFDDDGP